MFAGDVIARSGATQYSLIGAYTRLNSLQSSINTINSTLTNHGNRIAALEAWKATCNGNLAACGNAGRLPVTMARSAPLYRKAGAGTSRRRRSFSGLAAIPTSGQLNGPWREATLTCRGCRPHAGTGGSY